MKRVFILLACLSVSLSLYANAKGAYQGKCFVFQLPVDEEQNWKREAYIEFNDMYFEGWLKNGAFSEAITSCSCVEHDTEEAMTLSEHFEEFLADFSTGQSVFDLKVLYETDTEKLFTLLTLRKKSLMRRKNEC